MPHNIYYEKELKSPSLIICITIAPKGINYTSRHRSANTTRIQSAQNQNPGQWKGNNCTEIKECPWCRKHRVMGFSQQERQQKNHVLCHQIICAQPRWGRYLREAGWGLRVNIGNQTQGEDVEESRQAVEVQSPQRQHWAARYRLSQIMEEGDSWKILSSPVLWLYNS